jgi:TolA-binding protein
MIRLAAVVGAAAVLSPFGALAEEEAGAGPEDELNEEFRYIGMLQQMQMPDIAEDVIADVKKRFPEAGAKLKVAELQGMLSQGKFDDVQKAIDKIADKNSPEYWAMVLAKADAYYAFGKYPDADKLYLTFFKQVDKPGKALETFYRDSAYKYAQMLLYLGKDREGLEAYKRIFKVPLEEDLKRKLEAEEAELMIKLAPASKGDERGRLLKDAEDLVNKLLWKQDIWFGKAIVMKAHLSLLKGGVKDAQELVESYMPQLKIIHDALKQDDPDGSRGALSASPMPQCRYLLGKLLMDEAFAEAKKKDGNDDKIKDLLLGERDPQTKRRKGNGAFNHFINVFIRYPECQWAAQSGEDSEKIRSFIKERYGADLKTPVTPEQMAKVRQMQFSGARLVFSQNQFKEAIEKYLAVLNQFPESEESVAALGDLAFCYMEDSAKDADAALNADMVVGYLSERFAGNAKLEKSAGDQLRRIAEHYGDLKRDDKKREVYAQFFRDYPTHYAAPQLIWGSAEREFKAKNWPGAMKIYQQIVTGYASTPFYLDSLNRISQVYGEMGDHTNEMSSLEFYLSKLGGQDRPGHAMVAGKFRLAAAYREYGLSFQKESATNEAATAEAKEAAAKESTAWLAKAATGFGDVYKMLTEKPDDFKRNDDEKKSNEQIRETALFTRAVCLTQIAFPKDKVPELRKQAIAAFEEYVKSFPQGKYAPRALVQVGTIYTILEDAGNAGKAFDRLAKEYPDSDEAKNSVPMLAAALIDMGLRGEGVAKYKQMLDAGGKYTPSQFLAAATALENAREFDLSARAYDQVLSAKDLSLGLQATAMLGKARAQLGMKKYTDAHKTLDAFLKDKKLSKLQQMVDANMLLVDAASEEGKTEKDDISRTKLFNAAIDALKMVRNYKTPRENGKPKDYAQWTDDERAEDADLRLKSGQILVRRMDAESKLGLKDKAAATRGEAIVAFMGMVMSIDPGRDELRPVLESAYASVLPLLLEHKKFADAQEFCEQYVKLFPEGQHLTDVNNWLNQAKIGQ